MKYNLPSILLNPNKFDYSLDDVEIGYFKEAKRDLIKKYYNLVSKSIWKAILSNLKRRIEFYGTNTFIENLDENEKNIYFINSHTLTEKLSLLDNLVIIKNCLKLNIISGKVYTILVFFYWFNKNSSNEPILYEDIVSIVTLLEKNLFKLSINYKIPEFYTNTIHQNKSNPPIKKRRRKEDFISNQDSIHKRRIHDYINRKTKRIKKEDLFIIQETAVPKRRKSDLNHLKEPSLSRRKNDLIPEENQFIPRKRRKDDYINAQTIPNPRRRRRDD